MGKEVENVLHARNHTIVARVDAVEGRGDTTSLTRDLLESSDVVIEFSLSDAVLDHVKQYGQTRRPVVLGTTGWEEHREQIRSTVEQSGSALLWGANFSIGAQLFIRIVDRVARMINVIPEYDIMMYELHHSNKKDSPSGTARRIGETILKHVDRKKEINTSRLDRRVRPEELHIGSVRGGSVPGTHTVLLDSAADTIELSHKARNRSGFALGAVMAAEWIQDKTGFYNMDDFLGEIL